ncbi:MAG: lytic transglycosylase domain-containing protein [Kiritimatiellaeota bacterium]|nr:lytic transglycosylase domain-containing protein [Kiritimatiellota bacterium]
MSGIFHTARRLILSAGLLTALAFGFAGGLYYYRLHRFDKLIEQSARRHAVDPRLVSALIWRESRFNPACVGPKKEIGLMQVTETAALEWAQAGHQKPLERRELFLPATNIEAGTWYLARAIRRWSPVRPDPLPFALAEYNAGRSNAQRWAAPDHLTATQFWSHITYPATQRYVQDILQRYRGRL